MKSEKEMVNFLVLEFLHRKVFCGEFSVFLQMPVVAFGVPCTLLVCGNNNVENCIKGLELLQQQDLNTPNLSVHAVQTSNGPGVLFNWTSNVSLNAICESVRRGHWYCAIEALGRHFDSGIVLTAGDQVFVWVKKE